MESRQRLSLQAPQQPAKPNTNITTPIAMIRNAIATQGKILVLYNRYCAQCSLSLWRGGPQGRSDSTQHTIVRGEARGFMQAYSIIRFSLSTPCTFGIRFANALSAKPLQILWKFASTSDQIPTPSRNTPVTYATMRRTRKESCSFMC